MIAQLTCLMANVNRPAERKRPYRESDFMPKVSGGGPEVQSPQEMQAVLQQMVAGGAARRVQ